MTSNPKYNSSVRGSASLEIKWGGLGHGLRPPLPDVRRVNVQLIHGTWYVAQRTKPAR